MTRILVVDDDPVTLRIIHKMLREHNYEPITASTVKGALKILDEDPTISLIISDIEMPKADAYDLLRHRDQSRRLQSLPVIFCSSHGDHETLLKSLKAGACDFIVKPFQAETLVAKVRKALYHGKPSVLIVEDEETVRRYLKQIIEIEGFEVHTCETAEQGLLALTSFKIDLVLADVGLPEITGKTLAAQIKKMHQNIPVFLITGIPDDMTREMSLAYGAVGYISKPFQNTIIIEQLRNILKTAPTTLF